MKRAQKKQISMNDLAGMVARGFDDLGNKVATVDGKIDTVDAKLGVFKKDTDEQLVKLNQKIGKVENRTDEIYEILARFEEGDILDLQNRIKILERTVKAMSKRLL